MRDLARTTAILLAMGLGIVTAQAQNSTITALAPIGATLPELSPDAIASDVVRTRVEGRTTFTAQDFDPFETDAGVAGRAHLSSGEGLRVAGRDAGGLPLGVGAVLDVALVYAQESRDPYDLRGYTNASFLNGAAVRVASYEPRLLECSTLVSEAGDYPEEYFRGDTHGRTVGVYTRWPRYRGHRDFGFGIDRRRPYWNRRLGHDFGYGRDYGFGGRYGGDHGYGGNYQGAYVGGSGYYSRRDARRDARRRQELIDDAARVRANRDARARQDEQPRIGGVGADTILWPSDRGVQADPAPRRTPPRSSPDSRRGTGIGGIGGRVLADPEPRPSRRVLKDDPRRTTREPVKIPQTRTPVTRAPVTRAPVTRAPVTRAPATRTPSGRSPYQRRATPDAPRSRPKPQSRPKPRSQPRSQPKPSRVDRRTDRTFGGSNPKRGIERMRYQAERLVERPAGLCAKEERLSLFIPAERLEASRLDGLTVMVLDEFGRELPVFVPPNYVEGFLIATEQG